MDLRSGHPFWLLRNGLMASFAPLEKELTCDVVVVGGGITGALMGHHLIEAGVSTVVLDKRDIAWGSTAASTALLQYEIDLPLQELIEILGREHAVRAYLACRDAIEKIRHLSQRLPQSCKFHSRGSLYLACYQKDIPKLHREYEERKKAGIQLEWLSHSALRQGFAVDRPAALYSQDGGEIDPYRFTYELLQDGVRQGLEVYDRTSVQEYKATRAGVRVVTDRGAIIRAKHIVFATGYETAHFLPRKLVTFHSTYALVSEPIAGQGALWREDCLIWEQATPYLYLRTSEDRRVIVGGEDETYRNPTERDSLIPRKTKNLVRKFEKLFPKIKLEVAFAWAGTFGGTKDGLAYIGGIPEFPRAYFTLGFGGNGIIYSILAAEIIRDKILAKPNPHSDLFRFDR
jgi:glycine/D-amino acid oxidase-like deaminating enzyme